MKKPRGAVFRGVLAVVLVVALAVDLRWPILSLAPVLAPMRDDLGLSRSSVGLLTSLPLIVFGFAGPLGSWVGRRLGTNAGLVLALLVMALGILLRSVGDASGAFAGMLVLSVGVAVGNVLVPAMVKRDFPRRARTVTAVYTASLAAGSALGAAMTAHLSAAGWSWRAAIAVGAAPVLITASLMALPPWKGAPSVTSADTTLNQSDVHAGHRRRRTVVRARGTWLLTGYFGCQSLLYYGVASWLPPILEEAGSLGVTRSGDLLTLFNLMGIAGALLVQRLFSMGRAPRAAAALIGLGWAGGILGIAVAATAALPMVAFLGVTQGAGISMTFALIVVAARDEADARDTGATVQSAGYLLATLGPVAMGALRAASGQWTVPLASLMAVGLTMSLLGWSAARAATDQLPTKA